MQFAAGAVWMLCFAPVTPAQTQQAAIDVSDSALVRSLPGFSEGLVNANGIKLHYVQGGSGKPLLLLPGWPQTWWAYHKIMPALARTHRVVVVDLRGMGGSDKPASGYEKKNMAADIAALVRVLALGKVDVVGHGIRYPSCMRHSLPTGGSAWSRIGSSTIC
jgi:pimeloyl-ACP methyl ester carboxylesterase